MDIDLGIGLANLFTMGSGSTPVAFQGVFLQHSVSQTVNATPSAMAWDTENYDTDAVHDTVTNNSRITIPAAWNAKKVIFMAGLDFDAIDTYAVSLRQAGAIGNGAFRDTTVTFQQGTWLSAPIQVATGEYYEVYANVGAGSRNLRSTGGSWFAAFVVG